MQKNSKAVNVRPVSGRREFVLNLWQKHSIGTRFGQVNGFDFQISLSLWELQVIRDWLCVTDTVETSLNRLLLLFILKSSHRSCSEEKEALKSFTAKHLCWNLFLIKLQVAGLRVFPNAGVLHWNLRNF